MANKLLNFGVALIAIVSLGICLLMTVEETSTLLTWSHSGILKTGITVREDSTVVIGNVDSTEFVAGSVPDSGDIVLLSPDSTRDIRNVLRKINKGNSPGTVIDFDFLHDSDTLSARVMTQEVRSTDILTSTLLEILRFLGVIGFFTVGLWAFIKRPNSGAIRALALFSFAMGSFLVGSITIGFDGISGLEVPFRDYLQSTIRIVALFFGAFWLNLQILFPKPGKFVQKHPVLSYLLVYSPNIVAMILAISRILPDQTTGLLVMMIIMTQIAIGFLILWLNYRRAKDPLEKRQTRLVLWGSGVGLLGLFALTLFALLFSASFIALGSTGIFILISVVFLGLLIVPISFAYAFGKYRLLEVEGKLRRGTRFAIVTVLLLVVFYVIIYGMSETLLNSFKIESRAPALMLALVLAIGFTPAQRKIQGFAESKFFPERRKLRTMLRDFLTQASAYADKAHFWDDLESHLRQALGIEKIYPVVYDEENNSFIDWHDKRRVPLQADGSLMTELSHCRACPLMFDEALASSRLDIPDEEKKWLIDRNIAMVLPLQTRSKMVGMIGLGFKSERADFDAEECSILMSLASQAAVVADNLTLLEDNIEKQRLEKELAMARTVQRGLLPGKIPEIAGAEIAAQSKFCLEVAGDYYDVIKVDDRRTVIAIGDVSGKGAAAALLMSNIQASFRTAVGLGAQYSGSGTGPTISDIVYRINNLIHNNTAPADFITFFVGIFDSQDKTFTYVNAGHNPPMKFSPDGTMELLKEGGLLLGAIPDVPYDQGSVALESGDLIFLYTDGVSEAVNPSDDMFGEERIEKIIRDNSQLPPAKILALIEQEVVRFIKGIPLTDDFTMMAMRIS